MQRRAKDNSELLRAALSPGGRTRSGSGRASRRGTPQQGRSAAASREASDYETDDDVASVASGDAWLARDDESGGSGSDGEGAAAAAAGGDWEAALSEALAGLDERRAAAREAGLATIVRVLEQRYVGDGLEGRRVALLGLLRGSAQRPRSAGEQELAARAVGLWFVSFGVEAEGAGEFAATSDALKALVADATNGAAPRAAALAALGLANFVAGADYHDAAELARFVLGGDVLGRALRTSCLPVAQQALETAGLLLTVVADSHARLAGELFAQALDAHVRALTADSVGVRVAAAQNPSRFELPRHAELVGVLEMLRHESSKRRGRREAAAQRAAVRDVLATLEGRAAAPALKLAVRGRVVRFDTWARIHRARAFRAALRGGLPAHFAANPLLQDVFDVAFDDAADPHHRAEARSVVSPSSDLAKARSLDLRNRRHAARTRYRDDDDDDTAF
ncbi:Interferon- developmental regulator 1 [Coemansia javaensis]|uniref:Interferon- developmental regulator 1 n=1 Tax=Coemansia javaensis TaxID=2761396 RepID=A0A9W8HE44_9FUNG|nr:Interferon- developmental regulator 1 [Coemansia javaensis]